MAKRKHTKEFKLEALAEQLGGSQTACSLGLSTNLIYLWRMEVKQAGGEAFRCHRNMTAQYALSWPDYAEKWQISRWI